MAVRVPQLVSSRLRALVGNWVPRDASRRLQVHLLMNSGHRTHQDRAAESSHAASASIHKHLPGCVFSMFVSAKRQESQTPSNSGPASFPDPRLVYALVSYRAVMDFEWESLPWEAGAGGGYVLRVVARGMRPGVLHVQKAHKANERIHSQSHSLHKQQHEGHTSFASARLG